MQRQIIVVLGWIAISSIAFGQEDFHHHNVTAGLGAAIPVDSSTNYLGAAPMFSIGYGYRFNRFFQADVGTQFAFGAANNPNAEITDFGTVPGGDHEFMIPLGGRVYVPQPFKRIEVSAGGGSMYLHYSETVSSSAGYPGYQNYCYSCTSRGGWGGYGMANVSYFLDSNRTFRDRKHRAVRLRVDQWRCRGEHSVHQDHGPLD
ncbi:MAG: hypothetical protein LAO55_09390 [Acidobacteriia bacterium]|nr:hypothetical protein [Terriglobia bacterium]